MLNIKNIFDAKKFFVLAFILFLSIIFLIGCTPKEEVITIEELWNNRDSYLGKEVMISDVVGEIRPVCVHGCPSEQIEDPCCESCSANLGFKITEETDLTFRGMYEDKDILCLGNSCEMECYPFESEESYTMIVVLYQEDEEYYLELTDIIEI